VTTRIVLTGPESTGKTTLAAAIAHAHGAPWLPEASRVYAEERGLAGEGLTAADVEPIARRAMAAEDAALASGPRVLVLDTDLISTVVYARHYYGTAPAWLEAEAARRRGDLYLLCETDLPWAADGVRDRPYDRATLMGMFEAALGEYGVMMERVTGGGPARLDAALRGVARVAPDPTHAGGAR
jgi:NadR type nicotinamide-nucleotide adenylyltransferase